MTFQRSISKEDINKLPRYTFSGKVKVIEREDDATEAVKKLRKESILGFDTETRAAFKKGERYDVSLLQLGTESCVYLFRLSKLSEFKGLFSLLSDPNTVKAGVAIRDDIKALKKLNDFKPENFVDLAQVAQQKKITTFGLRALTAIALGKRLSKQAKVSNWDRDQLTPAQIKYAASDAAVGYAIYQEFFES